MSLSQRLVIARAVRTTWTAARERRRALESQLAHYDSDRDRADLRATLDRYPDNVTHDLREVLFRQARTGRGTPPGRQ